MMIFTDDEFEWLRENLHIGNCDKPLPRHLSSPRWLGDSNQKPRIQEFMDRGLMQPASGEFGAPRDKGETLRIAGRAVPMFDLISLYMLTRFGLTGWQERNADAEAEA